jgi:hypothetical protein
VFRRARKRLTLCETGVDGMPGNHCGFTKLPAEKDDPVLFHFPGEIDETLINVFEQASIRLYLFRGLRQLIGRFTQLRVAFDDLRQRKPPSRRIELYQPSDMAAEFAGPGLKFADSYFEPGNQPIRLCGRENFIKAITWQTLQASAAAPSDFANHAYVYVGMFENLRFHTTLNRPCRESRSYPVGLAVASPGKVSVKTRSYR